MLTVDRDRICRFIREYVMPPMITTWPHGDVLTRSLKDNHFLNRRRLLQSRIDLLLQSKRLPAAPAAISRDQNFGASIIVAIRKCFAAKSTKHHTMRRPKASA